MRLAILMTVQAVAGSPIPDDLRPVRPAMPSIPCGQADAQGDIVVCARSRDANRLPRLDESRYAERPVRAETSVTGKLRVAAEAEQGTLPNGQSSPRAMLRLKLPF